MQTLLHRPSHMGLASFAIIPQPVEELGCYKLYWAVDSMVWLFTLTAEFPHVVPSGDKMMRLVTSLCLQQ